MWKLKTWDTQMVKLSCLISMVHDPGWLFLFAERVEEMKINIKMLLLFASCFKR